MPPRTRQPEAVSQSELPDPAATPAPNPAVSMADVAALSAAPAAGDDRPAGPAPFMSEGMRHDLEVNGWAIDPSSGARFELDPDTGEVALIERPSGV